MNKIFKVVWNKARNCYVVGSELICNHSRGKVRVENRGGTSTSLKIGSWTKGMQVALAVMALCSMSFVGMERAYAEGDSIEKLRADLTTVNSNLESAVNTINGGIGADSDYGTDRNYVSSGNSVRTNIGLLAQAIDTHVTNLNNSINIINSGIGYWEEMTSDNYITIGSNTEPAAKSIGKT